MSIPSGPLPRPVSQAKPGPGWSVLIPVLIPVVVFVVGLVVIGLVYVTGRPADTAAAPAGLAEDVPADAPQTSPTAANAQPIKPASGSGEPYLTSSGRSPMPGVDENFGPPLSSPPLEEIPQAFTPAAPAEPVPWTEAYNYVGQTITVKGTIVDASNIGEICFLNYDPDWQDKFYLTMFKEAFDLLPDPPQQYYLNKTLLVTGLVALHKGRPQIEVRDVSQIEVVE